MLRPALIDHPQGQLAAARGLDLSPIVLGAYYLFIFAIPFQTADIGMAAEIGTIARLTGYLFVVLTVLKPSLCYKWPDKCVWLFGSYIAVYLWAAFYTNSRQIMGFDYLSQVRTEFQTLVQLVVLFWLSINLLRHDVRIVRRTLLVFAAACVIIATTQAAGFTGDVTETGRATVFETNPNAFGSLLMLGLLALLGLAYGRKEVGGRTRMLFWLFAAFLFVSIINTGSRGAMVALGIGFVAFLAKRANLGFKFKIGLIVALSLAVLVIGVVTNEAAMARWELFLLEGNTSGRDTIYLAGWQMFLEKPLIGWGPVFHMFELGDRAGYGYIDAHNLYLHVLTQVGLLGAVPFFLGIGFCLHSAWRARRTMEGILPLAMLLSMLTISAKGTSIKEKLLWFVLAYAVAAGAQPMLQAVRRRQRSPDQVAYAVAMPGTYQTSQVDGFRPKRASFPYRTAVDWEGHDSLR